MEYSNPFPPTPISSYEGRIPSRRQITSFEEESETICTPIKKVVLVNAVVDGGEMLLWKVFTKNDQVFYYKYTERKGYIPSSFIEISNEKEVLKSKDDILSEKNGFLIPLHWYEIDFDSSPYSMFNFWDVPGLISTISVRIPA
jgi:hypothetical protein